MKALRQLGNVLRDQGDWQTAWKHLTSAMVLAEYLPDEDRSIVDQSPSVARRMLWIDCIRERANMLSQQGKVDEAVEQFKYALECTDTGTLSRASEHLRGIILYQLGRVHLVHKRDVKRAQEYLELSIQILRKYDNPIRLSFLYDALGKTMLQQHPPDLEGAQRNLEKAKRVRDRCGHRSFSAYTMLGLGDLLWMREEHDSAIAEYKKARLIFNEIGNTRDLGVACLKLGTSFAHMGRTDQARRFLEEAESQFRKIALESKIREVEYELMKLKFRDELRGQSLDRVLEMGKAENYDFHLEEIGEYVFHDWIKDVTKHEIPRVSLPGAERELQERIVTRAETMLPNLIRVPIGGDDAAVMGIPGSEIYDLILNTDAAPGSICRSTAVEMGRYAAKFSVVQSLSDILAMGGTPVAVLLNMYLVRGVKLEYAMTVIETVIEEAKRYGAALIGGDMKERREQSVGCVGIGVVEKDKAIQRNGARPDHIVAITLAGMPDGSGVRRIGCRWAQEVLEYMKLTEDERFRTFCQTNWKEELLFLPCKEMIAGARTRLIESAIDTSDGFLGCLQLLGRESRVSFELDETLIEKVIDERVKEIAQALGLRPAQFLFNAGHDWEIVLTVKEEHLDPLQQAFEGAKGRLAPLGVVRPWDPKLEDGVALVSSKTGEKYWIPFFTDEKFVRRAYEERALDWEDLKYYLEGGRKLA